MCRGGRDVLWASDNLRAAVMGAVGDARKGEVGSGLTFLPSDRTLKSKCLPQWGLTREGTPMCLLRPQPWKRTRGD